MLLLRTERPRTLQNEEPTKYMLKFEKDQNIVFGVKQVVLISHLVSSFVRSVKNLGATVTATVCALIKTSLYLVLNAHKSTDPMVLSPTLSITRKQTTQLQVPNFISKCKSTSVRYST